MSKQILLADDSMTIQKVVELTFMDEDFEVTAVGSGDEALSRLESGLPDIVIADVHMPGASGYEVCRRAKARSAGLPVLLLVGTFESLDEGQLAACGADGHLKKPFDSQELLQVVLRMVREAESEGGGEAAPAAAAESEAPAVEGFESTHHGSFEALPNTPAKPSAGFSLDFEALADEPELPSVELDLPAQRDEPAGTGHETVLLESAAGPQEPPRPEPEEVGEEAEPAVAGGASASEADAAPGAAALSDADVDRVARRVVELLSPDTVREVAWDVIPDLAEIVIKDRIRELEAEVD